MTELRESIPWLDALFTEKLRAPYWWLWNAGWQRSWTFGTTVYENTAEFKLHMALYIELGVEAHMALEG
ncbi:hypothetical protein LCGC14_2325640 [marine sediment metagenome]|uniref:Uncharacterized protein n=1 Tax=marine sediment metagenome TaxID=412755 RepID=A0A0F9FBF6_9ZZZZ